MNSSQSVWNVLVVALLTTACANDTPSAKQDAAVGPAITVVISNPFYLQTSVDPHASIELYLTSRQSGLDEAMKVVGDRFKMVSLPERAPVTGVWTRDIDRLSFRPSSALQESDYLAYFDTADPQFDVQPRANWLFRVGSLPRIAAIEILPDKRNGSGYVISPKPSEVLDTQRLSMTLKVQADESTWTDVPTTKSDLGYRVANASAGFDLKKRIQVEVAYPNLDGKLTGEANSGNFVAEFVPIEQKWSDQYLYLPDAPELLKAK